METFVLVPEVEYLRSSQSNFSKKVGRELGKPHATEWQKANALSDILGQHIRNLQVSQPAPHAVETTYPMRNQPMSMRTSPQPHVTATPDRDSRYGTPEEEWFDDADNRQEPSKAVRTKARRYHNPYTVKHLKDKLSIGPIEQVDSELDDRPAPSVSRHKPDFSSRIQEQKSRQVYGIKHSKTPLALPENAPLVETDAPGTNQPVYTPPVPARLSKQKLTRSTRPKLLQESQTGLKREALMVPRVKRRHLGLPEPPLKRLTDDGNKAPKKPRYSNQQGTGWLSWT